MKAERERRQKILIAEGEKTSAILVAEALLEVTKASAESLKLLNESHPTKEVLSLKAMEVFVKVADGKATKIIIPSELQNIVNLATAFTATKTK